MPRLALVLALLCVAAVPAEAGKRGCFANSVPGSAAAGGETCYWMRVRMLDPAYGRIVWRRVRVCS